MKQSDFGVIVVGGGHAGLEAALAATRLGVKTLLITMKKADLGAMSCNPAIGGLGKGHLVREIDALDGVMGILADQAGIQFRLLNRGKGPAVQGPRAQSDRSEYSRAAKEVAENTQLLSILENEVIDFLSCNGAVEGVQLKDGSSIYAKSVVLTAGTFLRGIVHIGHKSSAGGRIGEQPSSALAQRLDTFGLSTGRLKTGTPPRLDKNSINWDVLEMQPGDEVPELFSFMSKTPPLRQVSCGITHTNTATHEIIQANLDKSAMYGGKIDGVGPRYCPSIEDKIVRFSEKSSHQIFLEPEGLKSDWVYPNGISTSLPIEVQKEYVQSIVGLERAEILQPGYAIEYDYFDPRGLSGSLEVNTVQNLFFAGQINGTTGYEEAAAQGLAAGLNAARRALGLEPVLFSRMTSYIGVMIDDLITKGVTEPYRMFTSRAEFRLSLRADNADQRLTEFGTSVGFVGEKRRKLFAQKREALDNGLSILTAETFTPQEVGKVGVKIRLDGTRRTLFDLLAIPSFNLTHLKELMPITGEIPESVLKQIAKDALYFHYISRQQADIDALKRDEALTIPKDFKYIGLPGLSNEVANKLEKVRPGTIGQAGRIEGVTPAALTLLLGKVRFDGRALNDG